MYCAFNRRGDLLATSGWDSVTRLWDPGSGAHLLTIPGDTRAEFTLDDRLPFHGVDGSFGVWEVAPSTDNTPRALGVSADGSVVAMSRRAGGIDILDASLAPVARLEPPGGTTPWTLRFGPGTGLLASTDRSVFLVWDLSRIREGLRPLGLDWESDPPPVASSSAPPIPVTVEADPGPPREESAAEAEAATRWRREEIGRLDEQIRKSPGNTRLLALRALRFQELGEWAQAVRDAEEAHRLEPGYRAAMNSLAWMLLMAPEPIRDPARAAALARESLEGSAEESIVLNTRRRVLSAGGLSGGDPPPPPVATAHDGEGAALQRLLPGHDPCQARRDAGGRDVPPEGARASRAAAGGGHRHGALARRGHGDREGRGRAAGGIAEP